MPQVQLITYTCDKGGSSRQFRIKKKDYGEMVLYDIFHEDRFLFTVSGRGEVLLSNWEDARRPPVLMDEAVLDELCRFILSLQASSLQQHA